MRQPITTGMYATLCYNECGHLLPPKIIHFVLEPCPNLNLCTRLIFCFFAAAGRLS